MNRKPSAEQLLRKIPTKWAIVIVVSLIAYTLAQPFLNRQFGWNLPSLASEASSNSDNAERALPQPDPSSATPNLDGGAAVSSGERTKPLERNASNAVAPALTANVDERFLNSLLAIAPADADQSERLYGVLKVTGKNQFLSPAGLVYTQGSEEGHRVLHVAKHLKDEPNRPSRHGVFHGDIASVLRLIDDAYLRAKSGKKGTRKRNEDGRTVWDVEHDRPIGYVGGRVGKRDGNPDARNLRLVVDGNRVITAYPM